MKQITHHLINMETGDRTLGVQCLEKFLGDTYVLYVKTQNFHWNVVDPRFYSLHKMFEKQYEDLAEAADLIAERIRALGNKAPGTMKEFLELSTLSEAKPNGYSADAMIKQLINDHKTISQNLQNSINEGKDWDDDGTIDLLIQRMRVHDKTAWMLESHLHKS